MNHSALKTLLTITLLLFTARAMSAYSGKMTAKTGVSGSYPFWIYTPEDYDGKQPLPVVIFLHGRSLCGNNLNRVLRYGTLDAIKRGMVIPAIVLAPQNPGGSWKAKKVMAMLDWVQGHYAVDSSRVYLLGMSLGGYGTLDVAGSCPDRIAAAMALCGGCDLRDKSMLGQVPLWILHGTADRAVPVSASKRVVADLQATGNDTRLRYDWLPGASHGALARAFYLKDTYDWLFAHSLADEGRPVERHIDIDNDILHQAYSELRELSRLVGEDDND